MGLEVMWGSKQGGGGVVAWGGVGVEAELEADGDEEASSEVRGVQLVAAGLFFFFFFFLRLAL